MQRQIESGRFKPRVVAATIGDAPSQDGYAGGLGSEMWKDTNGRYPDYHVEHGHCSDLVEYMGPTRDRRHWVIDEKVESKEIELPATVYKDLRGPNAYPSTTRTHDQ
ncbi:hypothetical protein [Natrinema sp. SYSU A 869]|uniref:hypothetical protein n=1 Tax=Natrinema sp. SYSU A 869 TaxID=2871694 RepID=UPI001CA41253|nr:hypothetical protein [Natrinema sp. SYSU A 869]